VEEQGRLRQKIEELDVDSVAEWTDGSRIGGRAAGATREEGVYLGALATIAGAEAEGTGMGEM